MTTMTMLIFRSYDCYDHLTLAEADGNVNMFAC